jgi:hypothetical protein
MIIFSILHETIELRIPPPLLLLASYMISRNTLWKSFHIVSETIEPLFGVAKLSFGYIFFSIMYLTLKPKAQTKLFIGLFQDKFNEKTSFILKYIVYYNSFRNENLNLLALIKFLNLFFIYSLYLIYINWKIYWSEQSFTDLGPEEWCSLWGLLQILLSKGNGFLWCFWWHISYDIYIKKNSCYFQFG